MIRVFSASALLLYAVPVAAKTVIVQATDVIFYVGQKPPALAGGTAPHGFVTLPPGTQCAVIKKITGSLPCSSPNGCVSMNGGANLNDPDGNDAQVSRSFNSGSSYISGNTAPGAGYLTGVFVNNATATTPLPAALDFTTGQGTAFKILAPVLDQSFFVGDGRTGSAKGAKQRFLVPAGAQKLYFGITDACGFDGPPSCYFDNTGSFAVSVSVTEQPCD